MNNLEICIVLLILAAGSASIAAVNMWGMA